VKRGGSGHIEVKRLKAKPLLKEPLKSNGITTIDKKMINELQHPLAKGAIPTIWPTSLLQLVICPKPILERKPCEELDFWWSPNLPNQGGDRG
jgi:hypothetical protein